MNIVKTIEKRKVAIAKIIQDEMTESPSAWADEDIFLVGGHRKFYVPFSGQKTIDLDIYRKGCEKREKTHWIFPLEAYIHSGVSLALRGEGNFPDRQWDVCTVGSVFVSKKEWEFEKEARKAAIFLIEEWNIYLSGDVYGVVIEDEEGNELGSCWGYYGLEYAEKMAEEMLAEF